MPSSTTSSTLESTSTTTIESTTSTTDGSETSSTTDAPTSTSTTAVAPVVPDVLPVLEIRAVDDAFTVESNLSIVDVLANDQGGAEIRIVLVTQPRLGSVEVVEGGFIEVMFPNSYAGAIEFEYEVTDESGSASRAVVVIESANVLAPVAELLTLERQPPNSLGELGSRAQLIYDDLLQVRLSSFQLTALSLAPLLFGLLYLILRNRNRERLVSVTSVPVQTDIYVNLRRENGSIPFRHDALLFSRSRTRRRGGVYERSVRLDSGQLGWVQASKIADTGY